jgi:hypothetical protein
MRPAIGRFWGLAPFSVFRKWCLTPCLSKDSYNSECTQEQCADGAANDERKALTRKTAELPAFGFDLARDGYANERDEDQRAGGG